MNTDTRRSIFFSIMTGIDVIDAYSKIEKLNLSQSQKKEISFVLFRIGDSFV
jgi:hypothetical protein